MTQVRGLLPLLLAGGLHIRLCLWHHFISPRVEVISLREGWRSRMRWRRFCGMPSLMMVWPGGSGRPWRPLTSEIIVDQTKTVTLRGRIPGLPRFWPLFHFVCCCNLEEEHRRSGNEVATRPSSCIYPTSTLPCSLIPRFPCSRIVSCPDSTQLTQKKNSSEIWLVALQFWNRIWDGSRSNALQSDHSIGMLRGTVSPCSCTFSLSIQV